MYYYVFYLWGDTRKGDRQAGVATYETEEEANKERRDIIADHPDAYVLVVYGEEISRS